MSVTDVQCCNGCKPPKRNGYCHATCKEYKDEIAKNQKTKQAVKQYLNSGLYVKKEK